MTLIRLGPVHMGLRNIRPSQSFTKPSRSSSLALSKQRIDARLLLAEILWLQSPARFRAHRSSVMGRPLPGPRIDRVTLCWPRRSALGALASGATGLCPPDRRPPR
ncbi:hypothetical protein PGT21_020803 [Puccinia graminis f. sp. tritici]|uniref:Uncharacterized protein n=1 Tax=Puccinia graminis f. sp. tritici TaxID=56615 RepID=A0A5B0MSY2_PUCGR|nr:hypothetical protein PGT21_020803 [Puccinia graminis f. sp. tritici]